jgi:ribosomal protein S21
MQVKIEKGESYEEALEDFNDIHQRDKIFSEMKKEILERNKENKDFLKLKTN